MRAVRVPVRVLRALGVAPAALAAACGGGSEDTGQSGPRTEELFVIENDRQRCTVTRESISVVVDGTIHHFQALRLQSLEDLTTGNSIDCSNAPLWRLDLRSLVDVDPVHSPVPWAQWKLVPVLNPEQNLPDGRGSGAAWVDLTAAPPAAVELEQDGPRSLRLRWSRVPVGQWHPGNRGTFTVHVRLRYADDTGPLRCSIDVELFRDDVGALDLALFSVAFPDLLLDGLPFGAEPADFRDDVLALPYKHGFLVPDPIYCLEEVEITGVVLDSYAFDQSQGGAYSAQYPGEMAAPFLFYYDMDASGDAEEPWFHLQNDRIQGFGTRPSARGGGQGLYLAAEDPDLNMKRVVFEPVDGPDGTLLRLGLRSFVNFTPARLVELKRNGNPGDRWQAYYQGPDSLHADPNPTSGTDLHFAWPVVLEALSGDWVDATLRQRAFQVAASQALFRRNDEAVPLRDLPADVLPPVYREVLGVVGLSEVTAAVPGGAPVPLAQEANVRAYLDWLREDWTRYQDMTRYPDAPWYGVAFGEGIAGPDGEAVLAIGSDTGNLDPRPDLLQFLANLRAPDPGAGWTGNVLAIQNRDSGTVFESAPGSADEVARRETGRPAIRRDPPDPLPEDLLSSMARPEQLRKQLAQVDDSLARLALDGFGGPVQVDWYFINGQWGQAKPDYSQWHPQYLSNPAPMHGVGGGNAWFQGVRDNLEAMLGAGLSTPNRSPHFLVSTERCNDMLLYRNTPHGHRQTHPVAVLEDNGDLNSGMIALAEPVPITSFLYHDYAGMRGVPYSFSLFYGLPYRTTPLGLDDPRYFRQDRPEDRALATQLSLHKLCREALGAGVVPIVGVELSGQLAFELEAGELGVLDSLDDRLSTSLANQATAGADDLARGGWAEDTPQGMVRRIMRARSQMRQFLLWGRRVRDPRPERPENEPNWWAEDLQVIRRDTLRGFTYRRYNSRPYTASNPGGMPLEALAIGAWADDDARTGGPRVLVAVANPGPHTLHYQLRFSPSLWDLPAGETYLLEARNLDLSLVAGSDSTFVSSSSGESLLPGTPEIAPGQILFWLFQIQ
ncbi:MAG: hypothetical protein EYC70_08340 [Planctomycetota bacterium]|nr:MAG: hypothetical protein EYC70_08340 [Planctomycetota bacterium]